MGIKIYPNSVAVEEDIKQKFIPKQKDEIAQEFNVAV